MQRRLLIIALVFVVGFGVGYGITWLLVGSSGRDEAPRPAATREAEPRPVAEADTSAPSAPEVAPDAAPSEDVAVEAAAAPDVAVEVVPEGAETAQAPSKAAWEACHMHACRLDFGKVTGGISIRKGSIEHGQTVDWDKDFAKADKIGTLDAGPNVKVEVLAIGLDNGTPAAAYILRKTKRDEIKGVIALRIGDKALALVPLEE